ncbi:CHAT domain-containing protein [Promicromonospora citrea]|uniref:CHAT domain-containing protein n=1 Tax=Promicromonospora citrea TaxID=43677 RepID=A0A8H9L636_9MICO|nr:CHAT domain-containing protein [Promicromonospora citrea]NNH51271.1 CHAT domain-containing protein [Promicromonospora citrea]GGM41731.1 CHAT domain-containing protein [Promicromonospora citrea]
MWPELEDELSAARELTSRSRPGDALPRFRAVLDRLSTVDLADLDPPDRERWSEGMVRGLVGEAVAVHAIEDTLDKPLALLEDGDARAGSAPPQARQVFAAVVDGARGLLLQRAGRLHEATAAFDRVLALADRLPVRDRATALLNRGAAAIEVGRLDRALADFDACHELAMGADLASTASLALHNTGFVRYALGDLPGALRAMAAARAVDPERSDGVLDIGRGAVLYEAGLLEDAEQVLTQAISRMVVPGRAHHRAEAEYFRARCLLALHRWEEARASAAFARRYYVGVGHPQRAAIARVTELEAILLPVRRGEAPVPADARRRAEQAVEAAEAGDEVDPLLGQRPGLTGRFVAAQWYLLADDVAAARAVLDDLPARIDEAPLSTRIQRQTVLAQIAFASGDRAAGVDAVTAGLGLLADHRMGLGSLESVTAAAVHGVDLQWTDVRAALATGRPDEIFEAVERGRATFAGMGGTAAPDEPAVGALVTEARGLVARARGLGAKEAVAERAQLFERSRRLLAVARERAWHRTGAEEGVVKQRAARAEEVRALLAARGDGAVLADFLVVDGVLRCVRIDAHGARLLELGPLSDVTERIARTRADLGVCVNDLVPPALRAAARRSLDRNLAALDALLATPLEAAASLYVAGRDPVIGVPWTALPSRRGLRTTLRTYVAHGRTPARPGARHRLLAAHGPGVTLGASEVLAVGRTWPGATVLTGATATADAVRTALATHDVVHLATHGRHDADNPLFASIDLADGPLFAHELDSTRVPGSVVILSACEVGGSSQVVGGEVLGLTSVLLRLGARAVVAAVAPLSDAAAARVMPRFHEHLRRTDDPEAALAAALADEPEPAPLVCFGSLEGLER